MSVKSTSTVGDAHGVIRTGYLKKLKTSKRKKFFVLRGDTADTAARLEYYDSEKKYLSCQQPKRAITLKSCFNINKQADSKHKHVIALYTKDDRFCVVFDNENELESWLKLLLSLQHGDEAVDGVTPRPTFEHVWQVILLKRGLGTNYCKEAGSSCYRLCLTDRVVSLIKKETLEPKMELTLSCIRSCGNLKTYFFLELGRSSPIGAGELWMETEDHNIAQNVHLTVYHAMAANRKRNGIDCQYNEPGAIGQIDDLAPLCRNRSSSATESSKPSNNTRRHPTIAGSKPFPQDPPNSNAEAAVPTTSGHTTATRGAVWSGTVNHQRTRSLPLAQPTSSDQFMHPHRTGKRSNQSSKCFAGSIARERCDSMPSRPRTTSEGGAHNVCVHSVFAPNKCCLQRPHSFYNREFSPSGSPITPPSAAGSTDSAGSSTSIDESENWVHDDLRCGYSHSLTPDEPIAEEDINDDFFVCDKRCPQRIRLNSEEGYVDMSPGNKHLNITSPTTSLSSITSGTPSTDYRFTEYNLEKHCSYLLRSDEDDLRHERTKSVGSRSDTKYPNHLQQSARERAFSCGAKTKKIHDRLFHPHHHNPKSSSAPLLQSSLDPKSDLMMLDFSPNNASSGYLPMKPGTKVSSGYVPMKPGVYSDLNQNHDKSRQRHQSTDSLKTNRIIMKGHELRSSQDNNRNQDYVDMKPGTSPKLQAVIHEKEPTVTGYMIMDMSKNINKERRNIPSPLSRSPISPSAASDYMDMNYNKNKPQNFDVYSVSPKSSISPNMFDGSPSSIEYIDVDPPSKANESYVEMTPGKGISHQRQSSIESNDTDVGDYANMSFTRKETGKKSQPIQIQTTQSKINSFPTYYFWGGKKCPGDTPPNKMHLPLSSNSSCSSLPRQQRSRRESKDSSSSSVTTPSSSSTLFPFSLNSPSSPKTPQESDYTVMDYKPKYSKEGDYAVMTPGSGIAHTEKCFRPINENSKLELTSNLEESPKEEKSRPGSTSSEVGSTTSTLVNSRPSSVNSDRARSGSDGLLYASLALTNEEDGNRSPRTVKDGGLPNQDQVTSPFPYAQIDFMKSDGFKHNQPILSNTKVKH